MNSFITKLTVSAASVAVACSLVPAFLHSTTAADSSIEHTDIQISECSLTGNMLSMKITNNADTLNSVVICALHKEGMLEGVWTESVTLEADSTTPLTVNDINIPDEYDGCSLNVMLWEGFDTMKPVCNKAVCEFNIYPPPETMTPAASYSPSAETVHGNTTADFLYRTYNGDGYSHGLDYRLYVPQSYDYTQQYPLFIYLNGAGSRGSDNKKQLSNLAPLLNPIITNEADYPCIIAVPQCPANEQWVDTPWDRGSYDQNSIPISDELAMVNEMVDALMLEYNIDSDRLYISGQSMGGYGTWDYITRCPDKFAAAIVNCGAADTSKASLIKDMPIMVLHGSADPTVPVSGSRDMVAALRASGSEVIYHEYEGVDHYVQRRLFENPSMWLDWLFKQARNSEAAPAAEDMNSLHSVEQFNSKVPAEWSSNQKAAWTIAATGDGMLKGTAGANTSTAIYNSATSDLVDYTASAYIKVPKASGVGPGIVVRYTNDSTLLTVRFITGATPSLQVVELQKGMETIMKNYPFDWKYDTLYNLKVSVQGNTLNAYVDNVPIIKDYPISRPQLRKAGAAGLRVYSGTMYADDFAVYLNNEQSLTLYDYEDYQVLQRDIGTEKKDVEISGQYKGTDAVIQARILRYDNGAEIIPWTNMQLNGLRFSGTVTLPQGGWYLMEARAVTDNETVMEYHSPNKFGVGINILCIGQSNMVGIGALASNTAANTDGRTSYTAANDLGANFSNGSWKHLADPYDNNGGSMIPSLANELINKYNIPIGFVPAAASGSGLAVDPDNKWPNWITRNAADHYQYSTLNIYGRSLQRAKATGGVELIIMNQGEHDVSIGTSSTEYERMLKQLHEYYKEDLYEDVPLFIGQLGASGSTIEAYAGKDDIMTGIRDAQSRCDNGKTRFLASTEMDLSKNKDEIHYNLTSLDILGKRMANSIMYYFGDSSYYRGPRITDAAFRDESRDTIDVHISHSGGDDFIPVENITGFEILDGDTTLDIKSVDKIKPDTIRITLSEPAGESFTLRYLYGKNPDISGILKDNSPLNLPLESAVLREPEDDTPRSLNYE